MTISKVLLAALAALASGEVSRDVARAFEKFQRDFARSYSAEELEARRQIFQENFQFIQQENAKGHKYTLAVNQFSDLSASEFAQRFSCMAAADPAARDKPDLGYFRRSNATLPSSVDWRTQGVVTPVKDQGQCGSCWAFSTTGSVESAWAIASGHLVSISEQQLVDCSLLYGNLGCNGGVMERGFRYERAHAICSEESYPYLAKSGWCHTQGCSVVIPKGGVTGYKSVQKDDTEALMEAVAQQPVSVAIEADQAAFQSYQSGVLTSQCGVATDHGVLIVGYGTEDGTDYWLVKNSWGASWGEQGYVKIERGVPGLGECGIKTDPTFPVVNAKADQVEIAV